MQDQDSRAPAQENRAIVIDDLVIDYSAAPQSDSPCWLMDIVPFSKTDHGARLFFPRQIEFRNISLLPGQSTQFQIVETGKE